MALIVEVPSYAKINWFLDIIGRRPDGFHEILTLFQSVDLSDTLTFQPEKSSLTLEIEGRELTSGKDNLVYRAAELLRVTTGCSLGARITLHKRIPSGAGLGGGSGNAAVTLLALNRIWNCGLRLGHLKMLAAELGSDVPYFMIGGPCLGWGRGDKVFVLEGLEREIEVVLVFPGFQVPTPLAYSLLAKPLLETVPQLTTECLENTIRRSEEILRSGNWAGMNNDFEPPVFTKFPALKDIVEVIDRPGAGRVILSGSGSSLIAVGESSYLSSVVEAAGNLTRQAPGLEVFKCRTLSRGSYRESLRRCFEYAEGTAGS